MRCPRCDNELGGKPAKCDQCKGCWVVAGDVPRTVKSEAPAWQVVGDSKIDCPECYTTMKSITLNGVHLDRCVQHGVWFDIGEITDTLRRTGKIDPGAIAKEDKPSTGSKVAEGAAGVGGAILEVVGTVFETVSDIV